MLLELDRTPRSNIAPGFQINLIMLLEMGQLSPFYRACGDRGLYFPWRKRK